nr:hypothetical protein [Tanacetum cinerariifolium]
MEIIPEEKVAVDDIPLTVKSPRSVDWNIHKEGKKSYYQIVRAEDEVWKMQQGYKVLEWKLYDSCGVYSLMVQSMQIYMLVEKKYPLTPPTLSMMLEKKLQIDYEKVVDAAKGNELGDLKERNFVLIGEKDVLFEKVKTLESAATLKETELASLAAQVAQLTFEMSGIQLSYDELSSNVAFLEFERDSLVGQAIGCAVNKGIQDGLRAGVDHGKAKRDLSVIEAYDPSAEAKYVEAMNALGTVDFPLLYELKSKKDARIVDLMDSFRLEGPLADIPGAKDLQPSPEQLRLLIHRLEDNVVFGETSISLSLQVVYSQVQRVRGKILEKRLSLTDVMVPLAEPLSSRNLIGEASTSIAPATSEPITTLLTTFTSSDVVPHFSISNDQVLHNEYPPDVTFEKEELETSLE